MPDLYVVRRSMHYGHGNGEPVDRGQLLELKGLINDEKLVRLGYVVQATKGIAIVSCGKCGAKFSTDETLTAHGRQRHAVHSLTPQEEDTRAEKMLALEDEVSPLDLTKTAASRGVRTAARR